MSSLRHRLFAAGFAAASAVRANEWLRPLARGCGIILTFHHVRPWRERAFAPNRLLEITPEFLDRTLTTLKELGFELIALDDLPRRLSEKDAPPFAVLTFDDGYRDNLLYAMPVLRRHGAPWTMFVTANYADGAGRLWWCELEEALTRLKRVSIHVGGRRIECPCAGPDEKAKAFERLYWALRAEPEDRLLATVTLLADEAKVDAAALVRELCLTWDELKALAREPGVSIGAHTVTHAMLAKHSEDDAWREMVEGRAAIAAQLKVEVRHFAFPVGDPTSAGPRDFALARKAGFTTAVTTRPGHVFPEHGAHLHALPRISVNGLFQSEEALRGLLSGVPFLAWNRGRRLNVS